MSISTIAVVAPSGIFDVQKLQNGIQFLKASGFHILTSPNLYAKHRVTAGTIEQRVSDFQWALQQPNVDAILFARGGYGCVELLEHVDISSCTKFVMGFSDATAMGAHFSNLNSTCFVHSPVLHSLVDHCDSLSQEYFVRFLKNTQDLPRFTGDWLCHSIQKSIQYPIVGGNLCMLSSILGTPWQLNCRNKILMLEEIGEPAYKIQRMLKQMIYAKMFEGCKGIVLGSWTNCSVPTEEWNLMDLIHENLEELEIPVLYNASFGHGAQNWLWQANKIYELDNSACISPLQPIEM